MSLRHFVNAAGNRERFFKMVEVRCPLAWLNHPKKQDIIKTVKEINLDHWNDIDKNVYINVCGMHTKLICHSAWEYWLIAVDEGKNDDDDNNNAMPQLLTENDAGNSRMPADLIEQQAPLLTREDTHVTIEPEVQREEEVDSEAETVITPHNLPAALIKEEVDINDCDTNDIYYQPIVEDISDDDVDFSASSVVELKPALKSEDCMQVDIFFEGDLLQNSESTEILHHDEGAEVLEHANIATAVDGATFCDEPMEGDASSNDSTRARKDEEEEWDELGACLGDEVYFKGMIT